MFTLLLTTRLMVVKLIASGLQDLKVILGRVAEVATMFDDDGRLHFRRDAQHMTDAYTAAPFYS